MCVSFTTCSTFLHLIKFTSHTHPPPSSLTICTRDCNPQITSTHAPSSSASFRNNKFTAYALKLHHHQRHLPSPCPTNNNTAQCPPPPKHPERDQEQRARIRATTAIHPLSHSNPLPPPQSAHTHRSQFLRPTGTDVTSWSSCLRRRTRDGSPDSDSTSLGLRQRVSWAVD